MNNTFMRTGIVLGFGLFMILALARCDSGEPLHMTILYETSKDLKRGNTVVYKGFEIGTVTSVVLRRRPGGAGGMTHVAVTIKPAYADMLYHQMDFKVDGDRDNRQIVVTDHDVPSPRPVVEGDLVLGTEGLFDTWMRNFNDFTDDVGHWLSNQGVDVGSLIDEAEQAIDQNLSAQDIDRVVRDLEQLAEESSEAVADQIDEILAYLKAKR